MASYQKWTINIKMMEVGKGKSGSIETDENEFYSEHDASPAAASTYREREREEKSDYRSAREGRGGACCTMCIRIDCDLCVLFDTSAPPSPKSISSLLFSLSLSLSVVFLHLCRLKLYVLPEEAIIHTFFLFEYVH